jgi:hypothetical protein
MKLREQTLSTLVDKAQRQAKRSSKHLWQRLNLDADEKMPLFVVGSQRSGTTMLMKVMEKSRYMRVFQEHSRRAFQSNWRLMPSEVIKSLIDESHAPVVVFKPLCDAHLSDKLLNEYPGSKAVWIFRDYHDVANSAVNKWNEHLKDVMRQITEGDWEALGWRGERLGDENIALVKRLYTPDMTPQDAASLQWYLRNQFYFALGLDTNPRVLLMRYEDLVLEPQMEMQRLMHFVGTPFENSIIEDVSDRSIGKGANVELAPEIDHVCAELLMKLNQTYDEKVGSGK